MLQQLQAKERKTRRIFLIGSLCLAIAITWINFALFSSANILLTSDEHLIVGQITLFLAILLNTVVIPTTHQAGKILHENYSFYQPLKGGNEFIILQAVAWTLYALAFPIALIPMTNYSALSGAMFSISHTLITSSLFVFDLEAMEKRINRSESGDVVLGSVEGDLWHPENKYNVEYLLKIDSGTSCFLLFTTLNLSMLGFPALFIIFPQSFKVEAVFTIWSISTFCSFWITNQLGFRLYTKFNGGSFLKPFIGGFTFLLFDMAVWFFLSVFATTQILILTKISKIEYKYVTFATSICSVLLAYVCLVIAIRYFKPVLLEKETDKVLQEVNRKARKYALDQVLSLKEREQVEYITNTYNRMESYNEVSFSGLLVFLIYAVIGNIHYFLFVFLLVEFQAVNLMIGLAQNDLLNAYYYFSINFALITLLNVAIAMLKLREPLNYLVSAHTFFIPSALGYYKLMNKDELVVYAIATSIHMFYMMITYRNCPEQTGSREWSSLITSKIWDTVGEYFGYEIIKDKLLLDFEKARGQSSMSIHDKTCILAFHPHGILPSTLAWLPLTSTFKKLFPNITARGHTASVLHYVPGLRDFSQLMGMRDVYRSTVELSIKNGISPFIAIGGQKEMFLSKSSGTKVKIYAGHKGFIRLAIKTQTPIIPIFSFGEFKLLDNVELPQMQNYTKRIFGFPIPFFPVGRFNLPIHRRSKVTVCFGKPIIPDVTQATSTEEDVTRLHKIYLISLKDMFERNKARCGYPNRILEFCF